MACAYLQSPRVSFSYLDANYSGREVGRFPDAFIEHAQKRGGFGELLKGLERRYLRTGGTKARKRQLQSKVVVGRRAS